MTALAVPPPVEDVKTEIVVLVPVEQCHRSPTQPRRRTDEKPDTDFIASIRQKGVIQPIVVRKRKAGGWEIVFGHRRAAGSALAGRESIPAIVREMTDDEVFEAQLTENIHRQDMHPLDEADGFKRMIDRGKTAQYIAEKIGRPITYVVQRLKLCELGKEVRAALDKDTISLGVAVLIARVPVSLQSEALETIDARYGDVSVAEAKRMLEASFLLRLDQAPFDIADAQLVAKAGACMTCPKRTGQQRELFPDVARADMCTDRVCYRGKLDAVWQIRKKEAAAGGAAVLEGKEAQRATGYGGGYEKLDKTKWTGSKEVKVRTLFGKNLPPVTLARDEQTGAIVELVKAADVAKVLKKKTGARDDEGNDNYRAQQRAQEARDRRRAAAINLAIGSAVERVDRLSYDKLIGLLTHALAGRAWNDSQAAIVRRREIEMRKGRNGGSGAEETLLAYLKTLKKTEDIAGLGIELVLRTAAPARYSPASPIWGDTLKALGVDFAALEKKVATEPKAKKKTKGRARAGGGRTR